MTVSPSLAEALSLVTSPFSVDNISTVYASWAMPATHEVHAMSIDKNILFITWMFLVSNILLALMDVDAAVRLARQHTAIQVIVTLVTGAVHQFDGCDTGSCILVGAGN